MLLMQPKQKEIDNQGQKEGRRAKYEIYRTDDVTFNN
jgi:hypothetical protein